MDKILISGEALDFSGNYNISLEANDFLNFKPGTAYKSERLTIFNTPKNRRLLGNIFHINADTVATFDCLFITDIIQMTGVLQILQCDQQKAEAVFISGNGKLWDEIKLIGKLNDLDCSQYNHVLNYDNVVNSETYNEANFYVYDFCDRGSLEMPDGMSITERFPAINLRNLLTKIFAGYTLTGDLINEVWFKRIFLLFTQPYEIRNSVDWKKNALIYVGNLGQTISLNVATENTFTLNETQITFNDEDPFIDNGANFLSNTYTVPETGTYRFNLSLWALLTVNGSPAPEGITGTVTFTMKKNSTVILTNNYDLGVSGDHAQTINQFYLDTQFMEFTAGDTIKCYVSVDGEYTTNTASSGSLAISNTTTLINYVSRWYGHGSMVDFSKILPDVDILSFLSDFFIYFGIYPFYNVEERTVYFYQLKSDSTLLDISTKIDSDDGVQFLIPEKANYYLKFAEDSSDKQMKLAIDNGLMVDGNYEFNIDEKTTNEIRLKHFCNTYFDEFTCNSITTTFKIPILWSDLKSVSFSTKFGLRLLYYEGTKAFNYNLYHGIESGVVQHARTVAPQFSNNETVNLQFSGTDGMYQYQARILQMITEGKVCSCIALLSADIISNFITGEYFRVPVYISLPYISGRFMVLKLRQKAGNVFELSLLQKFD